MAYMRLFIAINFTDQIKKKLLAAQNMLRDSALRGNFSVYDQLHLTLVFLGETDPGLVGLLREILNRIDIPSFPLIIRGTGKFKRDGGDIWWAGIEKNETLETIQLRLVEQLRSAGFPLEQRRYSAHVTLARDVRLRPDIDAARFLLQPEPITAEVSKISLMKSERISGRLRYTEIFYQDLPAV
jgi:2'-5' RNA ligase